MSSTQDAPEPWTAEVETWLAANWDPDITVRAWWDRLATSGWGQPTWPTTWFGRGLDIGVHASVRAAFDSAGALGPPVSIGQLLGVPTLLAHGTAAQQHLFIPRLARGEEMWCQLFSEPDSGSDLASARTRAVRDGDEWIIDGQKVWVSGARWSNRGLLLARTDADVPKHAGLTFFVIDLDQPGVEIRPLHQMNGESGFSEVFLTRARVPQDQAVGSLNGGWTVALTTLLYERSVIPWGVNPEGTDDLLDRRAGDIVLSQRIGEASDSRADPLSIVLDSFSRSDRRSDPVARQAVAQTYVHGEIARWLGGRAVGGSLRKLHRSALGALAAGTAMDLIAPEGTLTHDADHLVGRVQKLTLSVPSLSIKGGTDEIQRNIVGERVLGLPREPQIGRDLPFRELEVGIQRPAGAVSDRNQH